MDDYAIIDDTGVPEEVVIDVIARLADTMVIKFSSVKNCTFLQRLSRDLNSIPNKEITFEVCVRCTTSEGIAHIDDIQFSEQQSHDDPKCVLVINLKNVIYH